MLGELWIFQGWQMERTLEVLDEIEGCSNNSPGDLYHRRIVDVLTIQNASTHSAFAYHYARSAEGDGFRRLPLLDGCQSWSGA